MVKGVKMTSLVKRSSIRALTAARLSIAAGEASPDIVYLVGTNALVFAPLLKILGSRSRIIRHVFTSYDASDRAVRPVRWFANALFIDSYAFTTPRIGPWAQEHSVRTRRFLIRPPIDCDLYRPRNGRRELSRRHEGASILYMGPLWTSRFPAANVLRAVKLLLERGVDSHLTVLTSASRTTDQEVGRLQAIGRSLEMEDRLNVRRIDLTEDQRVVAYNEADVVIFPYAGPLPERLADPPFGILEAMACGAVVFATDVLSISEVLRDGHTGFLAMDHSATSIADGLHRALTKPNIGEIQRNARTRILRDFSYPRVCESLLNAFSELHA
jgi:glycosyltransferase involved in cell wall biosynthesis